MIKINVITNNFNWYRFIKIPDNFVDLSSSLIDDINFANNHKIFSKYLKINLNLTL